MNFELSDEQEMLREAARGALARHDTLAAARAALDGEPLPDLWPVAREAGWPGLLLAEEEGGAGLEAFDAMLVMQECGRRLAATGLLGHFLGTYVLRAGEGPRRAELLPRLAAGEARAACVAARPPIDEGGWTVDRADTSDPRGPAPHATVEGDEATVSGSAAFVPDAPGAHALVVVAESADGPVAILLDAESGGVELDPVTRYDGSRPMAHVRLDDARGEILGPPPEDLARAWHLAQALLASEVLGAAEADLGMGVEYAKERQAFGRPIGSYQAVKHQLVEALRGIETARALTYYAGWAAEDMPDEFALAANAARRAGEQAIDDASRTVMAVHGGIGATWEHDAHLYFRRAQLSRRLLGGLVDAGERVAHELLDVAPRAA